MQVEINKALVIGTTSVARAVTKVLQAFLPVESVSIPVCGNLGVPQLEHYRCLIQLASLVILVPIDRTTPRHVVSWVHLLRNGHFLCSGEILVLTCTTSYAHQLGKTSLFFEDASANPRYPLGTARGHQVLGAPVPLKVLLTVRLWPVRVYQGTWHEMQTKGSSLSRAHTIIMDVQRHGPTTENSKQISELRELLLDRTTKMYMEGVVHDDAKKKAVVEGLLATLVNCAVDTEMGRHTLLNVSRDILKEVMPWTRQDV